MLFPVLFARFAGFPVVSPRCISQWCLPRAVIPMQRVGVSVLRQRARVLVENESEQFPVASAVPVAPQWGEQRGKTTATNREAQREKKPGETTEKNEKWKKPKKNSFFILFSCFKIMPVHESKEKKRKSQICEIFFEDRHKS